ncbi:MAG: TlpA disulfide reductase family protein [Deferrisomatales bacterium]
MAQTKRVRSLPVPGTLLVGWLLLTAIPAAGAATARAPEIQPRALQGLLEAQRGRVVVVDYWATWCPPCRLEIPTLAELHSRYRDQGLAVIGISLDREAEAVARFLAKVPVPYPVYRGGVEVKRTQGIAAIPTTVFYDREGRLAGRQVGYASAEDLERRVRELLSQWGWQSVPP